MLYWMCKKTKSGKLTWHQMKHAIMRNFGGWESDKVNPFEEFKKRLNMDESELNPGDYDKEVNNIITSILVHPFSAMNTMHCSSYRF